MRVVDSLPGLGHRLLTERRGRTVLTIAGITLGVALFTGSLLVTVTATRGLDRFTAEANGQADVIAAAPGASLSSIVSPLGGEFDASVIDRLATLPDVEAVVALLTTPSSFDGPEGATEQRVNHRVAAALVGADLDEARSIYPVEVDDGRLPRKGADEMALGPKVADAIGAHVGGSVTIPTAEGRRAVEVVGVLADRGIGRLDRVGFTSLSTARRYADRPAAVSQVAIDLVDGADAAEWIDRHAASVPDGVVLSTSAESLRTFRGQIRALTGALSVVGLGLLATAGFLIYLTLAMSVVERTRLYGTMLALGATHGQIRKVVFAEALRIGVIGTGIGLVLGVGVAEALRLASARLLNLFGSPGLVIEPWLLAVAAMVGLATTLVSALVPARRAARVDPVAAIRSTEADEPLAAGSWIVGGVLMTVGVALVFLGRPPTEIGMLLAGVGAVRLVPYVVRPVARRLGPMIARLSPGGGRIAVKHLVAERTRSAYTLALIMLVMAMAVAITAAYLSFNNSIERQLTAQFGDDVQVTAASELSPDFVERLASVPGVDGVSARSASTASYAGDDGVEDIYIQGIDDSTYFDVAGFQFADGDAAAVVEGFRGGPSALVPSATAQRLGLGVGDDITMTTLEGPVDFRIVATADLTNIPPEFVVSRDDGARFFGATAIESVLVRVAPSSTPNEVRERIDAELGDEATFIATTSSELKADTRAQIGAGINGFFVLLLLAGVVGTFGLANTMAVSVFKRYREIGVLRAIGARRRQIQAMAVIEALTMVAVALVLALPLGMLATRPLLDTTREQLGDTTIQYETPWIIVPILAVIGVAVALIASVWPARRASHLEIDAALRFE